MNYKFRSFLYFIALVISVVIYYSMTYDSFDELGNTKSQVVDTEISDDYSDDQETRSYDVK
ncbi:MAG: hypothetical protein HKN89_03470 [Eudoraea sp.]|nr:hypothetical protein [Eudoraea sp.]